MLFVIANLVIFIVDKNIMFKNIYNLKFFVEDSINLSLIEVYRFPYTFHTRLSAANNNVSVSRLGWFSW